MRCGEHEAPCLTIHLGVPPPQASARREVLSEDARSARLSARLRDHADHRLHVGHGDHARSGPRLSVTLAKRNLGGSDTSGRRGEKERCSHDRGVAGPLRGIGCAGERRWRSGRSGGGAPWFFGGWAVDLWVGRLTRPHDDIDVLVWRRDEPRFHEALLAAGWLHVPTPEDEVGTNYAREQFELQVTFVIPGDEGGVVVPIPDQPMVLSVGPLAYERRALSGVAVSVVTLEMMLASKGSPRPDEVGAAKDRADLAALRSVAGDA